MEPRSRLEGFFVSWRSFLFGLSLSRLSPGSVAQRRFCLLLHRVGHHCDTLLPNELKRTSARLVRKPSTWRLVGHFGGNLVKPGPDLSSFMPQKGRNTICAPSSAAGMLQSFLYSTMNRVPHLAVTIGRPTKRVYSYSYRKATMGSTRIARRAGMEDPREGRNLGGGHTWATRTGWLLRSMWLPR